MKRSLIVVVMLLPFLFGGKFTGRAMDEEQEKSKSAWLGVSTSNMTPRLARTMHLKTTEGALVKDVIEDSPAEEAGIRENDIIVEFNGTKIIDAEDLRDAVRKAQPGTAASIVVSRDDQTKSLKATLEKAPAWYAGSLAIPRIPAVPHLQIAPPRFSISSASNAYGLRVRELNKQLGKYFGAPNGRGVLVEEVEEGSQADSAGFKAGDVIVKIQNDQVIDTRDVWDALDDMKDGELASVEIIRKGASQKLSMRVEESPRHGKWFRSQSLEIPDFDRKELRREMEKFQQEMRNMGKEIENQTRDLRRKLREEFGHVTT
jgi:C-terminal processing protease CtpA/Prc